MRQCLTTEGAETPARAARKADCEKDAASRNPATTRPPVNGRQMICGRLYCPPLKVKFQSLNIRLVLRNE